MPQITGNAEARNAAQEFLQQAEVEHGLGDHVFGAGFHLALKTVDLFVQIYGAGIRPHPDHQRGLGTHGPPADVESSIQVVRDSHQANGIDIEHRGGFRIYAHARRVARDADEVAHTQRVGRQKLGLNAENVAVAAAEVIHRFDTSVLLNQLASRLCAEAGAGARPVRMLMQSMPCPAHRAAPAISREASVPRGGSISTKLTKRPSASLAPNLDLSRNGTATRWASGGALGASARSARAIVLVWRGCSDRVSETISLVCSGVVPQHPPMILAPACSRRREYCAMYSGELK